MIINQYLQKIPVDRFTRLTAAWRTCRAVASPQARLYAGMGPSPSPPGFLAEVLLPHKTPLHEAVQGEVRPSKRQARWSAALKVVELLHGCKELDDHLRIIRAKVVKDWEEKEWDPVTRKRKNKPGGRRWHSQHPPLQLVASVPGPGPATLHLHQVCLRLVTPHPRPRYRLHRPQLDRHCLGLLCPAPLPSLSNISLYTASGRCVASVHHLGTLSLTREQLALAQVFHRFVVNTILSPAPGLQWQEDCLPCPLFLPLVGRQPDMELCRSVCNCPFYSRHNIIRNRS